jgi:mRNA-degrading endonuclease toxin of MazEF toxin-antitoxin module
VKKPEPQIGLVIRYDFLWSHEREKGLIEGAKERPCVIVTAITRKDDGAMEILVAPITHSPPQEGTIAIEIPHKVGRHLGLDDDRSFIIANESNSVSWDDAGIVPVIPGKQWEYGRIPKGLYDQLRSTMLDLLTKRKLKTTKRDH